ncbi:hypothetical protein VTN96DRAFT_53 [Rasamsonia emersonii]
MESKVFSQNLLLDANDDLKFSDFVGSSIDGEDAHVCASAPGQFRPPWSHCPSVKDVMFAMGVLESTQSATVASTPHSDVRRPARQSRTIASSSLRQPSFPANIQQLSQYIGRTDLTDCVFRLRPYPAASSRPSQRVS